MKISVFLRIFDIRLVACNTSSSVFGWSAEGGFDGGMAGLMMDARKDLRV